jgi:hypothetical protein
LMSSIDKNLDTNRNSSDGMDSHFRTLECMAVDQKIVYGL